ncbi:hypothetical protein CC78DRAFT_584442 [Lojkania enalia]|uniref:Uncharacterized protein n=1 Tax=Lojkania enalia TaxID=147567 RepID=A0A9P4N0R6_9PLEO|nr:hypothetical protein CC78DRAFT_584442 [Didymosphaeria enalia]
MPALPTYFDAITSKLDSLVVRDPEIPPVVAREPAPDIAAGGAIAPNALNERATLALAKRQVQQGVIPSYYDDSGPDAGMVVGIVLGSVAGFLLIVWLLYSLTTLGGNAAAAGEEEIVVRRRRGSDSRRSRRSTHTEMRDYSRSPRRRDHIIVEERRAPRTRSIIVEERARVPGDDVVEVIEEHDEYRERRGGRRSGSRYR